MKNYAYMIFLTILSHLEPSQFTLKRDFPLGHPSSKCSGPSTLDLPLHLL
jgi:hypothetical protein